jgi:hypothetical protein
MEAKEVRDIIVQSLELELEDAQIMALGNRVHIYSGDKEFEVVVKTMTPKGSSRHKGHWE